MNSKKKINTRFVHLDRLKKLVSVYTEIEKETMRTILEMDKQDFEIKLLDWAQDYGFKIKRNLIIIENANIGGFLGELDKQFEEWIDVEEKKESKILIPSNQNNNQEKHIAQKANLSSVPKTIEKPPIPEIPFKVLQESSEQDLRSFQMSKSDFQTLIYLEKTIKKKISIAKGHACYEEVGVGISYKRVEQLSIKNSDLSEIPEAIGRLSNLNYLNLEGNKIFDLPKWLLNLEKLRTLKMNKNQLSNLPDWLVQMKNLRTIYVDENPIVDLPETFLTDVKIKIETGKSTVIPAKYFLIPSEYSKLLSLEKQIQASISPTSHHASYSDVAFQATDKKEIYQLSLKNLGLKSIPQQIKAFKKLYYLTLDNNQISEVPLWITELERLSELSLSNNNLKTLPSVLANHKSLRNIYLNGNPIESLPEVLKENDNIRLKL
jgi:Leucine-rich repeat (LRR) protein